MCQTTLRYDGEYLMVRFEPTTLLHIVMKTNPLLMGVLKLLLPYNNTVLYINNFKTQIKMFINNFYVNQFNSANLNVKYNKNFSMRIFIIMHCR